VTSASPHSLLKSSSVSALDKVRAKKDQEKESDADYEPEGEMSHAKDDDEEGDSSVESADSDLMEFSKHNIKV